MTKSKTEIEIEWVKNILFPKILTNTNFREDNSIEDTVNDNVKLLDVQVKFIGVEEAFMLTNCYRALITLKVGDRVPKTTTLIIKKTPKLPQETFDAVQYSALFSNEILAYETILPEIERFAHHSFNIPRFYYGELGRDFATIALKDFGHEKWQLAKQKVNLSLSHALVAVKSLGIFHGIGFALRHKNRAEFDRLTKDLREARFEIKVMHPDFKIMTKVGAERLAIVTPKYQPQIDVEFLQRYSRLISDFLVFGRKMVAPIEPLVTLCHGDYLRNNIAFKYTNINGTEEPIDALMFDLQTTRVSSPMLDFATFLSLSTYTSVRYNHFDEIFDHYYNHLVTAFKDNTDASQIPDFLSRESLLREYARLMPCSVSIASHFLMQLVEPEDILPEEKLSQRITKEELKQDIMTRGGEEFETELTHQVKELYDGIKRHNIDIFKGFDGV